MRDTPKSFRVDPVQNRTNHHSREHQNDHVGHSGKTYQAIRHECQNQQAAKHRKKEIEVHTVRSQEVNDDGANLVREANENLYSF